MSFIVSLLGRIGLQSAFTGTQGCYIWFADEPSMPQCLLTKN